MSLITFIEVNCVTISIDSLTLCYTCAPCQIFLCLKFQSSGYIFLQYTVKNLQFALTVEPDNVKIQQKLTWAQHQRQAGIATIPSTIEEELETNPFMRVDLPEIQVTFLLKELPFSSCWTKLTSNISQMD